MTNRGDSVSGASLHEAADHKEVADVRVAASFEFNMNLP